MTFSIPAHWHGELHQHVIERYRLGNLPHAILVYGDEGIGKARTVDNIVQNLLCQNMTDKQACGHCHACNLYMGATHPNFTRLAPEKNVEKNTQSPIKIDQIRELSSKLVMTSQYEGPNIAVIEQADMMNHFAANSLLKTLEEPTANTVIFLITSQPSQLLPTIHSRCQNYLLNKPSTEDALAWLKEQVEVKDKEYQQALQIAAGAPLNALTILENNTIAQRQELIESLLAFMNNQCTIAQLASLTSKLDFAQCIAFMQNFLADVVRAHHSDDKSLMTNPDLHKYIKQLSAKVSLTHAYTLLDDLNKIIKTHNASINAQLMLESFFASWHNMTMTHPKTA